MDSSFIIFLAILALSFFIGWRFSKKGKATSGNTEENYFLGNRQLGFGLLTLTFAATQIGGGFILGTADAAFQEGPFALLFPVGYCLGFLGLGLGFGARLRNLEVTTASDIFLRFYKSPFLKRIAGLLSVVSLTGILMAQAVALRAFLFSAGWGEEWIFLTAWAVVIFYTTQGGFLAVVWTDAVQAIAMISMLFVTFFFCLQAPTAEVNFVASAANWELVSPKILGYLLMPCLFTFIEQDMCQRCFAAKTGKDVSKAASLASLLLFVIAAIPVVVGMMANTLGVEAGPTSKFMEGVKLLTNKGIASAAATAVLLAIISTASSLLSAASSNLVQDFGDTLSKKPLTLRSMKLITLATGLIALFGSYTATNILSCMIASYEISVAALFVPFVTAVFLKERCIPLMPAAFASCIAGTTGFMLTKLLSLGMWGDLLPLTMSATAFGVSAWVITRKPAEQAA